MRILFLTQVLPYPLDAGPKIRAYYTLRYLAQMHEIVLVSFVRETDTPAAIEHLRSFCASVRTVPITRSRSRDGYHLARSLFAGTSFIIDRDWVPAMAQKLVELAASKTMFDAVHADQLWMAPYALWFKDQRRDALAPVTVLDQHNAVYMIFDRLARSEHNPVKAALLRLEARKLAGFEVDIVRRFDHVTWVTQDDFAAVQSKAPTDVVIPNDGIIPICGDPASVSIIPPKLGARRVTFLGGLHYPPNAQGVCWFARDIFPAVLTQVPDAVLTVIGKSPPADLQRMGIPAANLEVTGYVDDPASYLAETAAFIVPLLAGGGMRVKIVDGWCWGLPIVSTGVGAEGIQIFDGENILLADEPAAFAQHVVHLLHDSDSNHRIREAGRCWVEQRYNWRTVYDAWNSTYKAP